jgi:PAS domain S-box-containing protein
MRRSEENFRQIFEATPFPLLISRGTTGEILMANQTMADYLGIPLEELVGSTVLNFYGNSTNHRAVIQALDGHGKVINWVLQVAPHAAQQQVMLLNVIAIERNGEQFHLAGAADVTAQIAAEEAAQSARTEAEEASRAKSMFLANMSHELLGNALKFTDRGGVTLRVRVSPDREFRT